MKYSAAIQNIIVILLAILFTNCFSQENVSKKNFIDEGFEFGAGHWYRIADDDNVINPLPNQKRYSKDEYVKIADNILLFQKNNGGWPKNYDMMAILTDEQKLKVAASKEDLHTTIDNGATHSQLKYLAEVYNLTKDEKYKESFLRGIDYLITAQYENGGWPQFYPDVSGYRKHITFNDGAMVGVLNLLLNIIENRDEYSFIDEEKFSKINYSLNKGIECILKCQIIEDGKLLAWGQQHDSKTLLPEKARAFEPACISNAESAGIVEFLMKIKNPSENIKNAINCAVQWFNESKIEGIKVKFIRDEKTNEMDKIILEDPDAPTLWARYYELKTHKPIFGSRDGKYYYSMNEIERERRVGYGWHTDQPQSVLDKYPKWKLKNSAE